MAKIDAMNRDVSEFSLIYPEPEKLNSYQSFRDAILRLASVFRRHKLAYEIEYFSNLDNNFRLRSDRDFVGKEIEEKFKLNRAGSEIYIRVEKFDRENLRAIGRELTILAGYFGEISDDPWREKELNLLLAEAFKSELKIEMERFERYETKFTLLIIDVLKSTDWKQIAKELKHAVKAGDVIGLVNNSRVVAVFPDREPEEKIPKILRDRLNGYEENIEVTSIHVPEDCRDWEKIESYLND